MKLESKMAELNNQMNALLDQRNAFYDHMKEQPKQYLIDYYELEGGTEMFTIRDQKHDIIVALMDLVYSVDAVIARKQIVYNAMKMEKGEMPDEFESGSGEI
jgi:hypothetical protein